MTDVSMTDVSMTDVSVTDVSVNDVSVTDVSVTALWGALGQYVQKVSVDLGPRSLNRVTRRATATFNAFRSLEWDSAAETGIVGGTREVTG